MDSIMSTGLLCMLELSGSCALFFFVQHGAMLPISTKRGIRQGKELNCHSYSLLFLNSV